MTDQMTDHIKESKDRFRRHCAAFRQTFGVQLRPYWDLITGFDITLFDAEIIKSGNRAVREVVTEKYGEQAALMLETLL